MKHSLIFLYLLCVSAACGPMPFATDTATLAPDASVPPNVAVTPQLTVSPSADSLVSGNVERELRATVVGAQGPVHWALEGVGLLDGTTGLAVKYFSPYVETVAGTATITATVEGTDLRATVVLKIFPKYLGRGVAFYRDDGSATVGTLRADGTLQVLRELPAAALPAHASGTLWRFDIFTMLYVAGNGSGVMGEFNGAGAFYPYRQYEPGVLPVNQTNLASRGEKVLMYKDNTIQCGTIDGTALKYTSVTSTPTEPGWTLMAHAANETVLLYRPDGTQKMGLFDPNCIWHTIVNYPPGTPNWTHLMRTAEGTLYYRKSDGAGAMVVYQENGDGQQVATYRQLKAGWDNVVPFANGLLFYATDGSGEWYTFAGPQLTLVKTYSVGELPRAKMAFRVGDSTL